MRWHAARTPWPLEGIVAVDDTSKGARVVVSGRVAELRRFEACERALAQAHADYTRAAAGGARFFHLVERHRRHAALLAARIVALGGRPRVEPDDAWIAGPTDQLGTLVFAEHQALRAYRDHLLDFDPESMMLVRQQILPDHERTLDELTGERPARPGATER